MSEPIRYNCTETACDCCASVLRLGIIDAPIGEYVRYEDYARLKAENERLAAKYKDALTLLRTYIKDQE